VTPVTDPALLADLADAVVALRRRPALADAVRPAIALLELARQLGR